MLAEDQRRVEGKCIEEEEKRRKKEEEAVTKERQTITSDDSRQEQYTEADKNHVEDQNSPD